MKSESRPLIGISLRPEFFAWADDLKNTISVVEILPDEIYQDSTKWDEYIEIIGRINPEEVVAHSFLLSIGSSRSKNTTDIVALKHFLDAFNVSSFSDHFSFNTVGDIHLENFVPIINEPESKKQVIDNINYFQDKLEKSIDLETITTVIGTKEDRLEEARFMSEVSSETGCGILLDINNIYVNSQNFKFSPSDFLERLDTQKVEGVHLGGFTTDDDGYLIDTHAEAISDSVWSQLPGIQEVFEPNYYVIERDNDTGSKENIILELSTLAKTIYK